MWRPCLHTERCFKLQKIAQITHGQRPSRIKSEHPQQIGLLLATFEQRRRREFVQRNGGSDGTEIIKKPLTQRIVQFAENEVIGFIDADLTCAFAEIPRLEIRHHFGRPRRHFFIEQSR